jgi:lambda family phage portal protein
MFDWLKGFWSRSRPGDGTRAEPATSDWTLRRWEAADTNRLNKAQWQNAHGQTINVDLLNHLEPLRARAALEVSRNPTLEGVINTFCTDVVGRNGPTLQVQSDDPAYNAALEQVWKDWFCEPDLRRIQGGVDILRSCVRGLWINGEFLLQKVTATAAATAAAPSPIAMRLKSIHPRRLATAPELAGDASMVMGVRQTFDGEPLEYSIGQPIPFGAFLIYTGKFSQVPARDVIHRFMVIEEDQARGVPWLATPLQAVADLRDYDAQVLDAARQAADQAVYWYTDHPDANYIEVNETTDIERRTQTTGPPGWKPAMLNPTQPATNYIAYRSERQSEMGRPVGMPLMMIRLDSSGHNYSSARFDGQIYLRGLEALEGWLERRTLNGLVRDVEAEARLYAAMNPRWMYAAALRRRPARVDLAWTWPKPPHVDPTKEGTAERIGLENGTLPYSDALAARGSDLETVIAKRKRENQMLADAGLPPLPTAAQPGQLLADQVDEQDAKDAADQADAAGRKAKAAKPETADA